MFGVILKKFQVFCTTLVSSILLQQTNLRIYTVREKKKKNNKTKVRGEKCQVTVGNYTTPVTEVNSDSLQL